MLQKILLFGLLVHLAFAGISTPVLRWSYQGPCFNSYCQTGWYSSPLITQINGKGAVVGGGYTLYAVDGENGTTLWSKAWGGGRIWPAIVEADIDGDGVSEIVTGNADTSPVISVLRKDGTNLPGWPQNRPSTGEIRALTVGQLDSNVGLEIVVGAAAGANINTWVYNSGGTLRSGWPQPTTQTNGYSWGIYNNNFGIGDLDGDGVNDIVAPSDVHYVNGFRADGSSVAVPSGYWPASKGFWGLVPFNTLLADELLGYSPCPPSSTTRTNFADAPVSIGDIDGNGMLEYVFVGRTYYFCNFPGELTTYNGIYITHPNRTRWANPQRGFDWRSSVPTNTTNPKMGDPLSMDYNVIQNSVSNNALGDLDGDGVLEVVYSSYDGKVHAFWMDKTEKFSWPYSVSVPGSLEFSSEPVIVDLDNDGFAEVVIGTWPPNNSGKWGSIRILSYQGVLLQKIDLPVSKPCAFSSANCANTYNGVLGAVSIGNIDSNPDMEIVALTISSGLVAYRVPNSANARLIWATSRGNYRRDGRYSYSSAPITTTGVPQVTTAFSNQVTTASSNQVTGSSNQATGTNGLNSGSYLSVNTFLFAIVLCFVILF